MNPTCQETAKRDLAVISVDPRQHLKNILISTESTPPHSSALFYKGSSGEGCWESHFGEKKKTKLCLCLKTRRKREILLKNATLISAPMFFCNCLGDLIGL